MAKFQNAVLNVNGKEISSNELTYDDLVWLYNDYIKNNDSVPTTKNCKLANNLPAPRIVMNILKENDITYKDFIFQFGKSQNVRMTNVDEYDYYLDKLKKIYDSIGRCLTINEFVDYGLPSSFWFVKYCPNKTVKKFSDFVNYLDLESAKHIWTKEELSSVLIEYEKKVNRPITRSDFTPDKLGVSMIVINRLYGGLTNAKEQIGLLETLPNQPLPFEHYKGILEEALINYKRKNKLNYITWAELESGKYCDIKINHKSISDSFNRAGEDLYAFINSFGLCLKPNTISKTHIFEDGEMTDSNYEYLVTTYLRECGLKYKTDYFRAVKYNTFTKEESKRTCDYLIKTTYGDVYVEVAGLLYKPKSKDWRKQSPNNKIGRIYLEKMIKKEKIFQKYHLNYCFIFSNEIYTDVYKKKIDDILNNSLQEAA